MSKSKYNLVSQKSCLSALKFSLYKDEIKQLFANIQLTIKPEHKPLNRTEIHLNKTEQSRKIAEFVQKSEDRQRELEEIFAASDNSYNDFISQLRIPKDIAQEYFEIDTDPVEPFLQFVYDPEINGSVIEADETVIGSTCRFYSFSTIHEEFE